MFATFKMLISIIIILLSTRLAGSDLNWDDEQGEATLGQKIFRAVSLTPFRCETDPLPDLRGREELSNGTTLWKYWDVPILIVLDFPADTSIFLTVLVATCLFWLAYLVNNRNKSDVTMHGGFRFSKLGNTCPMIGRKRSNVEGRRKDTLKVIYGTRAFKRRKKMCGFIGNNVDCNYDHQRNTKGTIFTLRSIFANRTRFLVLTRGMFANAQLCDIYVGLSKYPTNTYREHFDNVREEMRSLLKPATYIRIALDNREASTQKTKSSIFDKTFDVSVVQKNFTFFGNDMVSVYQFGSLVLTKMLWDKSRNFFRNQQHQVRCLSNNALSTEV